MSAENISAHPNWLNKIAELPKKFESDDFQFPLRGGDESTRKGAVLILFSGKEQVPEVLITLRSSQMRSHAGQPSFPGGAIDLNDKDATTAALRESEEEVGLRSETVEVIGVLPELWLPPSNFHISPVVAWWRDPHEIAPQSVEEVVRAENISLIDLAEPANRAKVRHKSGYIGPAFNVAEMLIWGFTAGIIDRILFHSGYEREWDHEKIIELAP
ncbi:coenzyme A pyrophosphatase [Actinomycetes bacterium]|nr:coenzyme A pyrophosphatase [Actinomycetes bacterium]